MAASPSPFDQLWHAYQQTGDERYKAELTQKFMPILVSMAEDVRAEMGGRPILPDLVNAGLVGLLEAFKRFDPSRGVYFETYCAWRVLGAMHDDQRKLDWASGAVRLKAQRLRAAEDELTARFGRPPADEEVTRVLGISLGELAELRQNAGKPASLQAGQASPTAGSAGGQGRHWHEDRALEDPRLDPARLLLVREARTLLLDELKGLPDKHRYVLLLYYFEQLKMAQIGQVLGVSEARVSQLHKEALERLVRRLGRRRDDFLDALGV